MLLNLLKIIIKYYKKNIKNQRKTNSKVLLYRQNNNLK